MEFAIFLGGFGKIWGKEAKMASSIARALSKSGEGGGTLFSHPHSTHPHEAGEGLGVMKYWGVSVYIR